MCGFVGSLSPPGRIPKESIFRATCSLAHRGPDGDGFWIDSKEQVGLGHRRLAIIDLSDAGRQPMAYSNGRYHLTFNGEIYNYVELRADLEARGHRFVSTSDTEVLLALFSEKKEKCLDELDGMFAFAIWDDKERRLFAARDRFGEKPFYYGLHEGTFYFGSEMKALWAAGVPRVTADAMIYNYLAEGFMYDPRNLSRTFFNGISKLKAAHYFYISPDDLEAKQIRYWTLEEQVLDQEIPEADAEERFRELFTESVKRRLRSDVPVGSSLSGGLDSSLVVCTIDRLNKETSVRQATFSARFPGFTADITLSIEGFSAGLDPQTNQPPPITKKFDIKPVLLRADKAQT
jgi:asparagine synthase (glutamine-hydrolysing)